jgi:hypothetical protein
MWRPLSRMLERLGRLRLRAWPVRSGVRVGSPAAPDAQGGDGWRRFATAERLHAVWGPPPGSPWAPFHGVPLFAALERVRPEDLGPGGPAGSGGPAEAAPAPLLPGARPGVPAPGWIDAATLTLVDLPGPRSVPVAAWLVVAAGCQPVCTFDHWPHPKGVLRPERTLAELLRWAGTVAAARARLAPDAPPLWVCDAERLGERPVTPGEFDNRYFLDDSVLPGPAFLRQAGIERVVYATLGAAGLPTLDLRGWFDDLLQAGFAVLRVDLETPGAALVPLPRSGPVAAWPPSGYRRSAAGGFGSVVPEPTASGG